ncbi:MAG: T9SS type A sorting domain-containing protein, partial [Bacteroidota bacterium]
QLQIESLEEANTELIEQLNKQEQINEALEERLMKLEQSMQQLVAQPSNINATSVEWSNANLEQNQPNPFTESTTIPYFIPEGVRVASLHITNAQGKLMKQISIREMGHGQVVLDTTNLNTGTYSYSLILDGKAFDTKQIICVE